MQKMFSVQRDGFYGVLYRPHSNLFSRHCMIVLGGSEGSFLLTKICAKKFAAAGLSALALAYHGKKGLPKEREEQPVDSVMRAARWLLRHGYERVGVWGASMGGGLALLAGSLLPEWISCVIAVAPLRMVMQAEDRKVPVAGSSFAFAGRPLPYANYVPQGVAWKQQLLAATCQHREPYAKELLRRAYRENANPAAEIAVEHIAGPLLLLGGALDSMCPNEETFYEIQKRLLAHGFSYPFEQWIYPHLSHLVLPFAPASRWMFVAERRYPQECARQREESWQDTWRFLQSYWL